MWVNIVPVFRSFIFRYLLWYPGRAAPAVLGIAVGVAVVLAIRLANVSVLEAFRAATDSVSGNADLRIYAASGPIAEEQLAGLLWLEQWGDMAPVVENYGMLVTDDTARLAKDGSLLKRNELLLVLGVDVLRDQKVRRYEVWQWQDGKTSTLTAPEILDLLMERHSIVLTERFARRVGLRVGDSIPLAFGSAIRQLTVRGLLRDAGPARTLQGNFALMDIAAAQWASDRYGFVDYLDIRLHDGIRLETALDAIQRHLPAGLLVEPPATRATRASTMIAAFQFNLAALSMVALIVGLFLVYSTIAFSVTTRQEEIGILLALGTTRLQIVGLFLGEALVLALIGSALGVPLGQLLARSAVKAASATVETFYIAAIAEATADQLVVPLRELLVAGLLALVMATLGSSLPAWKAASLPPLSMLRYTPSAVFPFRASRAWGESCALALVGLICVPLPMIGDRPVFGFVAALFLAAALARTAPVWLYLLCQLLPRCLPSRWISLRLAVADLAAGGSPVTTSLAALGFSLGMMFAIAIMVASFRTTVVHWLDSVLTSDLVVKPVMNSATLSTATLDPGIVEELRSQPEVLASAWYSSRQIPYGRSMVRLDTSELAVLIQHGRIAFKEPHAPQEEILAAIAAKKPFACISESFSLRYHKRPGDTITINSPSGPVPVTVIAVYYDYSSNLGSILIDYQLYKSIFNDTHCYRSPMAVSFYFKPGVDVSAVRQRWADRYASNQALYFVTNREVRDEALRIFDSTFTITYALQLIAVLVAAAGIVSTLVRLIHIRKREIALLNLMGMSSGSLQVMIVAEAFVIGLISQWIGWLIGVALSLVLIFVINVQSFGWTIQLHFPVHFLLQATAITVGTSLLFGWLPARWVLALDPLTTVRDE